MRSQTGVWERGKRNEELRFISESPDSFHSYEMKKTHVKEWKENMLPQI